MDIVLQGNKKILQLLHSIQSKQSVSYCQSRFLLRKEIDEGVLVHNCLTGELVFLTKDEDFALRQNSINDYSDLSELIYHRFFVPNTTDELKTAEQLRRILRKRKEQQKIISKYNILPTTNCNARCFYCYESDIKHVNMSPETSKKLVEFISAHYGERKVVLHWFGGEPTLGKLRIDQICQQLDERSIEFISQMTSNGYLFNEELAKHAKKAWRLKTIQITLDGTENVYNAAKSYVGIKGSAFKTVLKNIEYLLRENIHVSIRLSLDQYNNQDLEDLIDEIASRFHDYEHISAYIGILNEGVGFAPISRSVEERDKIYQQKVLLETRLKEAGLLHRSAGKLPALILNSCMADNPEFIQCTPDGILSKCEDQIFEHTIGDLQNGITEHDQLEWWAQRDCYEECSYCPIYPSCKHLLKHCPAETKKCNTYERDSRLSYYYDIMLDKYNAWKQK